nr:MAG TPA: hypothetical protein [Caudoviricetes sp.]
MTTDSACPKKEHTKSRWVHLHSKHSLYYCVLNSYASRRPNAHLGH